MFWMNDKLVVGIADMKMAQGSGMLVTYALGSCIGICFYDPMLKLAALLHIMLIPASGRRCGKWSGEAPNGRGLQPKLPAEPACLR